MSLSLFRYNTNFAIILNLCDAVSNLYNLLLIVGVKSSTKGRFKSCAIVVWNSADQISISANELRFLKQQGHQAWWRSKITRSRQHHLRFKSRATPQEWMQNGSSSSVEFTWPEIAVIATAYTQGFLKEWPPNTQKKCMFWLTRIRIRLSSWKFPRLLWLVAFHQQMLLALLFIDVCFQSLGHTMLYITEAWNTIFASQTDFDTPQQIT